MFFNMQVLYVSSLPTLSDRHEFRFATSVITGILYGHQVVSEDDEYMKLMDHQSMIAVNLGQPGGALLDILPFREAFLK